MFATALLPSFASAEAGVVVLYQQGCQDYFVADGPNGYYLLEWYGGYDPSRGDVIAGDLSTYGMKTVSYPQLGQNGTVWVDDYLLSRDSALSKYKEKCGQE